MARRQEVESNDSQVVSDQVVTQHVSVDATKLAQVSHMMPRANLNSIPSNWNIQPNPDDSNDLTIIATSYINNEVFIGTREDFSAMLRGE